MFLQESMENIKIPTQTSVGTSFIVFRTLYKILSGRLYSDVRCTLGRLIRMFFTCVVCNNLKAIINYCVRKKILKATEMDTSFCFYLFSK